MAKAMAETTQLEWKPYDGSPVLSAVYTVFFWKEKPGWVDVKTGSREQVLRRTNELTHAFWHHFRASIPHGPNAAMRVLRGYGQTRTISLDTMRQQFAEAQQINAEVIAMTGRALTNIARVKLATDIVFSFPGPPMAVSLPYAITTTFIKEINRAESANVVLVQVGKESAKELAKDSAEKGSHWLTKEMQGYEMALQNAKCDIIRQSDLLRRETATAKSLAKASGRLGVARAASTSARQGALLSRGGSVALGALAWGFVAYNIREAWHDYSEIAGL